MTRREAASVAADYLKSQPYMSILHLLMLLFIALGCWYGVPAAVDRIEARDKELRAEFQKKDELARKDFRDESREQREMFRETLKELKEDCRSDHRQGIGVPVGAK